MKKFQPLSIILAILNVLFQYESVEKIEKLCENCQIREVKKLLQEIIKIRKHAEKPEYEFRMFKSKQKANIQQLFLQKQFQIDLTRQELKQEEIEKMSQFYGVNIEIIKGQKSYFKTNSNFQFSCIIAKSQDGQYYQLIPKQFEQLSNNLSEYSFMEDEEPMKQSQQPDYILEEQQQQQQQQQQQKQQQSQTQSQSQSQSQSQEIAENIKCSQCKQILNEKQQYKTKCHHIYCESCLKQLFAIIDTSICCVCQSLINYEDYFQGEYQCNTCQHFDRDKCIQVQCSHYLCLNFIKQQLQNNFPCHECQSQLKQSDYLQLQPIICDGCGSPTYNAKTKNQINCDHSFCMDCFKRYRFQKCQLCEAENLKKCYILCPICQNKTAYSENQNKFTCNYCFSDICPKHKKLKKLCCCFQCDGPLEEISVNKQINMNCKKCDKMICIKCFRITQSNKYHLCHPIQIETKIQEPQDLQIEYQCSSCQIQGDKLLLGKNGKCSFCQLSYEYSQSWNQLSQPSLKRFRLSEKRTVQSSRIRRGLLQKQQQ